MSSCGCLRARPLCTPVWTDEHTKAEGHHGHVACDAVTLLHAASPDAPQAGMVRGCQGVSGVAQPADRY